MVDEVWNEVEKHAPEALQDAWLQRVPSSPTVSPLLTDWQLDRDEQAALSYALTHAESGLHIDARLIDQVLEGLQ